MIAISSAYIMKRDLFETKGKLLTYLIYNNGLKIESYGTSVGIKNNYNYCCLLILLS